MGRQKAMLVGATMKVDCGREARGTMSVLNRCMRL